MKSKITEFWMSGLQNSSKFKDSPQNMAGGPTVLKWEGPISTLHDKNKKIRRAKLHLSIYILYGVVIFATTLLKRGLSLK